MKLVISFLLLISALNTFGQRFELRPNALFSFHNIAKVPAAGLKLEALAQVSGKHYVYTGFEMMHGEGNAGFKDIKNEGFYSYRFDDPATGHTSSQAFEFKDAITLKVKSARLNQAALKVGYLYRMPLKKNVLELSAYAYGNYVAGFYVVDVLENIVNYNPNGDNIELFVVHYFFNYLDIGPGITVRYVFHTKNKAEPVVGLDYNYGTHGGSWASLSVGLRLK